MYNAFNPVNRNYFATPAYKRGFQADSGAYGGGAPSINYQQQMPQFAPVGPGFMGMPQYGGDPMMYSGVMPGAYHPRRRYGARRAERFTPYMEQMQPFAGIG